MPRLCRCKHGIDDLHDPQYLGKLYGRFRPALQNLDNVAIIVRPIGLYVGQRQLLGGMDRAGAMVRVGPASV